MKKFIIYALALPLSALVIAAAGSEKIAHYELSRFISPEMCGGCHSEIYQQWKGSLHNLSLKDRIYVAVARDGLKGITLKEELA